MLIKKEPTDLPFSPQQHVVDDDNVRIKDEQSLNSDQELLDQQLNQTLLDDSLVESPSPSHQRVKQEDSPPFLSGDGVSRDVVADDTIGTAELSSSPASSHLDQTPSDSALPPSNRQVATVNSESEFIKTQIADQPRRPWTWSTTTRGKKISSPYHPKAVGKWWYNYTIESEGSQRDTVAANHICRIMESELGVQLPRDQRCTYCKKEDMECWIYSDEGKRQVRHPGSACARCRARGAATLGCSVSTRRHRQKNNASLRPTTRELLPQQPLQPMNPNAGAGVNGNTPS